MLDNGLSEVKEIFENTKNFFVFAGAGLSVELGMSTYWSGGESLYGDKKIDTGYSTLDHANASLWREDYVVQRNYCRDRVNFIKDNFKKSEDNSYSRLLKFFNENNRAYSVATSNTDGAFEHYGFQAEKLYEAHGSQHYLQCMKLDHGVFEYNEEFLCEVCGSLARSNVMHFDDYDFNLKRETSQSYEYLENRYVLEDECLEGASGAILILGVGESVSKMHSMARVLQRDLSVPTIHINTDKPSVTFENFKEVNEYWLQTNCSSTIEYLTE